MYKSARFTLITDRTLTDSERSELEVNYNHPALSRRYSFEVDDYVLKIKTVGKSSIFNASIAKDISNIIEDLNQNFGVTIEGSQMVAPL